MSEELQKTAIENGRLPDGTFAPGFSGNPKGRTRKKHFRDYFTEEEEADLISRIKQGLSEKEILKLTVEQIFGKARQPIDGGLDEEDKPIPIFNVPNNHSNRENKEPEEKD